MANRNPRTGSNFDDFLKEEGMFEEIHAKALKRALMTKDSPRSIVP